MACTKRSENEMKMRCKQAMKSSTSLLEKLRLACLARGANGIKGLARTFKIMDDDRSKSLDKYEFKKGIEDYGICEFTSQECDELFDEFDKDHSGTISFDEFLVRLKPPMNNARKSLIHKAFKKLDRTGDGVITVEDIRGVYKVDKHPKYISGEWTADQVLQLFLDSFDSEDKDGQVGKRDEEAVKADEENAKDVLGLKKSQVRTLGLGRAIREDEEYGDEITKDEFENYYVGVSASVDNDAYFDLMMRNAWKL